MVFSAITFHKLLGRLTFGMQQERRKWLCFLEMFVQIMLTGRLIIIVFQVEKKTSGMTFIVVYSSYLFLTELVPFAFLIYSMIKRLKVYKKARKHIDEESETTDLSL